MLSNITTQLTDDKENGECFVYSGSVLSSSSCCHYVSLDNLKQVMYLENNYED